MLLQNARWLSLAIALSVVSGPAVGQGASSILADRGKPLRVPEAAPQIGFAEALGPGEALINIVHLAGRPNQAYQLHVLSKQEDRPGSTNRVKELQGAGEHRVAGLRPGRQWLAVSIGGDRLTSQPVEILIPAGSLNLAATARVLDSSELGWTLRTSPKQPSDPWVFAVKEPPPSRSGEPFVLVYVQGTSAPIFLAVDRWSQQGALVSLYATEVGFTQLGQALAQQR